MNRRPLLLLVIALVGALAFSALPAMAGNGKGAAKGKGKNAPASAVQAGVGVVDATWHVGAGGGQYSSYNTNLAESLAGGETDPHGHSTTKRGAYGVQSRMTMRAIVVEGANGKRAALVKSDNYLAQDLLLRRVGQLLEGGDSGVTSDGILHAASHNHSSPYYATHSPGVWLFQDAFDQRMFEYQARKMAEAIELAADDLRPARMSATTVDHSIYKGNIVGPAVADDGTPAGFPSDFGDDGLVVMRFDDVSGPKPKPLAAWMNFGQHPESLDGHHLITADFLAPLERYVDRELGAPLIFTQGDVGSAEGPYDRDNATQLEDGTWRVWAHVGHAQTERGARLLADSVIDAWKEAGTKKAQVPFSSDFDVDYDSRWVPGPISHPYPSVSNCRSEPTAEGNPGAPIIGLPDCQRPGSSNDNASPLVENLKMHGVPVPDHYNAPGFPAVEENNRIRLQSFKIGDVLLASCGCEAQADLILNLESRTDRIQDNIFDGYDWGADCTDNSDGTWACAHPRGTDGILTVSDANYRRMQAQVHNDAAGWDAPENAVAANSEPSDPEAIWGNFTKEELSAREGYGLSVGVGHAGDYNGYTVSYREYMSRDHYRKALTAYGPHTADYMVTRLVRMAGGLNGGAGYDGEPHDTALQADEARQEALARVIGAEAGVAYDAWNAALAGDVGPAEALDQPENLTRFAATTFSWRGGSNAVDNPLVRVERRVGGTWRTFADMTGEVQTRLDFPNGIQGVADTHTGRQEWVWTANFEAYDAFPARLGSTPEGTYRFVVDGVIRDGRTNTPYTVASDPFTVSAWDGLTASDARVEPNGDVSFASAVAYPRTYESDFEYVAEKGSKRLCHTCSFRPWATTGELSAATVTVTRADGTVDTVRATRSGDRWTAPTALGAGDTAVVAPGGLVDTFGNVNASSVPIG